MYESVVRHDVDFYLTKESKLKTDLFWILRDTFQYVNVSRRIKIV